jgi:hypothetical protein
MTTRKMTSRTRKTRDGEIYERTRGPEWTMIKIKLVSASLFAVTTSCVSTSFNLLPFLQYPKRRRRRFQSVAFQKSSFAVSISIHWLLQSRSIVEDKLSPTYSTGPLPRICIAAPPHRVSHSGPKTREIDSPQCSILFIRQKVLAPFCSGFPCHSKVG